MNILNNLKTTLEILENSKIDKKDWSFGGGTALMFEFKHRVSKDIDIFFQNPQLLTYLSPRVNDFVEDIARDYKEQSNFLKIYMNDYEIDFIVAPNLTGLEPELKKIYGMELFVENPIEIIAKKLFYRPEDIKVRDVIDTVIVYRKYPQMVEVFKKANLDFDMELIGISLKRFKKEDIENTLNELSLKDRQITKEDFYKLLDEFKMFLSKL